jgi:glycine/D-amino acid oxidase-like deaminating enzyme
MDLKSGTLYWPTLSSAPKFPRLERSERCDALVIGAGISGALVGYHLARAGVDTVIVDRREVATGSTPASTALVQYEIDTPLLALARRLGREHADGAYRACRRALDDFARIVRGLDDDCGLERRRSLFLARRSRELPRLEREARARRHVGIEVELVSGRSLLREFGIQRSGALLSTHAYECDPLRLTSSLLRCAARAGARVYARTAVRVTSARPRELRLRCGKHGTIRAASAVLATGYETPEMFRSLRRLCQLRSTYAIAAAPLAASQARWPNAMLWESGNPYFYARGGPGGTILAGGCDEDISDPRRRDAMIPAKSVAIARKLSRIVPGLHITPRFAWAGTFAQSHDGLPFIGATPKFPDWLFALGYGGNGFTFSVLAAQILTDAIQRRRNPDARLFRFDRFRKTY